MIERVTCSKCGTSIHPDTAKANGGACMPCSGKTRAARMLREFEAYKKTDAYKLALEEASRQAVRESQVAENAPWFGKTGLDDEIERHVPRYLRLEFGESLLDEGSLKASDLIYLGSAGEANVVVHYWRVEGSKSDQATYAYVEVEEDGTICTGWGDRSPPKHLSENEP